MLAPVDISRVENKGLVLRASVPDSSQKNDRGLKFMGLMGFATISMSVMKSRLRVFSHRSISTYSPVLAE